MPSGSATSGVTSKEPVYSRQRLRGDIPSLPPANITENITEDAVENTFIDTRAITQTNTIEDIGIISVVRDMSTGQTLALNSRDTRLQAGETYYKNNKEYICLGVYHSLENLNKTHSGLSISSLEQWNTNE